MLAAVLVLGLTAAAEAGLRRACRRQCEGAIAECVLSTRTRLRTCKRLVRRRCRREGLAVNHKRIERLYREEGLSLRIGFIVGQLGELFELFAERPGQFRRHFDARSGEVCEIAMYSGYSSR